MSNNPQQGFPSKEVLFLLAITQQEILNAVYSHFLDSFYMHI